MSFNVTVLNLIFHHFQSFYRVYIFEQSYFLDEMFSHGEAFFF